MVTVKVFDVNGVKEVKCFDTLDNVPYIVPEEVVDPDEDPVEISEE